MPTDFKFTANLPSVGQLTTEQHSFQSNIDFITPDFVSAKVGALKTFRIQHNITNLFAKRGDTPPTLIEVPAGLRCPSWRGNRRRMG